MEAEKGGRGARKDGRGDRGTLTWYDLPSTRSPFSPVTSRWKTDAEGNSHISSTSDSDGFTVNLLGLLPSQSLEWCWRGLW